jgi:hypothetical protein
LTAACTWACASAGQYGHARTYEPLDEEEDLAENAVEYDPILSKRFANDWKKKVVSVFGIVLSRSDGPGGTTRVKLSVRALEPRNLCEDASEESCRVTVSEREHAVVDALIALQKEDALGQHSVGAGSLVRVLGKISDEVGESGGAPLLRGTYYRHWPRDFYVTTAARSHMLR